MDTRQLVAERGLVGTAASALATRAFTALPFDSLATTKTLLKRFFSPEAWGEADDEALAEAVGTGEGWWRERLDDELVLEFGWVEGRFRLRVEGARDAGEAPGAGDASRLPGSGPQVPLGARRSHQEKAEGGVTDALGVSFDGPVVPEATPNPRTLAFRTGRPIHHGESRSYRSGEEADDPRAARLLGSFPDVTTVLVARDFVAVTLRRPDRWEALLAPVLSVVAEEFVAAEPRVTGDQPRRPGTRRPPGDGGPDGQERAGQETRLERAWRELGSLRAVDAADLERVLAAARDGDAARRQVAARLLIDAPPEVAGVEWARLVGDSSRAVRRSTVDSMVDAGRQELRPLLEGALGDADAWVRWKALRGLVELGPAPSRDLIEARAGDPDFRVRLEALSALKH